MPGNPVDVMLAKYHGTIDPKAVTALEEAFGVSSDKNLFLQYGEYLCNMLSGNWGISIGFYPATVEQVLYQAMPWTIGLAGISTIIAFLIGTYLGIVVGWNRDSVVSSVITPLAIFFNSMPYFWFALVVQYIFAFVLGWFPLGGGRSFYYNLSDFGSILYHSILPAVTIVLTAMGGWMLTMRNNMINVLAEDYITFAQAQGLPEKEIKINYAARNAVLPSITGFAMAIGFVVSGTLLTEIVFSYPGVGNLLYQSVLNLDYPLMQAIFFFISIAVIGANLLIDLVYVIIDPRVREGEIK